MPKRLASGNRAVRPVLLVRGEHLGVIHLVNVVTRQNEHIIGIVVVDKLYVLINRVRRALIPFARFRAHKGRQHEYTSVQSVEVPRLAVAYVLVELERLILREHAHGVYAAVYAVGQGKVYDAVLRRKGYGGLCHILGEHPEPRPLPARKQHGDAFLFDRFFHFFSSLFSALRNITEFAGMFSLTEYG